MTCYVSPLHSQVKGESHASVCGSRSHALIPTGARSRPAALPKPIIISVPRPHCWKGSASKPYVELPPHTAPLGMEVGPAQACALKVVVHDLIRIRPKPIKKERTMKLKLAPSHLVVETPAAPPDLPKNRTCEFPRIRLKRRRPFHEQQEESRFPRWIIPKKFFHKGSHPVDSQLEKIQLGKEEST